MTFECVIGGRRFTFGDHAAARWQERFRPLLTRAQAGADLARLLSTVAVVQLAPPEWANAAEPSAEWIVAGDVALPVAHGFATTVIARGTPSDARRAGRSEARARRAAARRRIKSEGRGPKGSGGKRTFTAGAGGRKNRRGR